MATSGHNNPPGPIPLIETDGLADRLREEWAHLFARKHALVMMTEGWFTDHANGVQTAEDATTVLDMATQVLREVDGIDKSPSVGLRADTKRPIIDAGRIIDRVIGELADPLRACAEMLRSSIDTYNKRERERIASELRAKQEAEARALREAELKRRQEEADRLAAIAAEAKTQEAQDAAIEADQRAMEVQYAPAPALAEVSREDIAKASRVTGEVFGATTSMAGRWTAAIENPRDVPREYCVPDQRLIDAAMRSSIPAKGKAPTIKIPGVKFTFEETTRIRR